MTVYFHMINGDVLGKDFNIDNDVERINLIEQAMKDLRNPATINAANMGGETYYFRADKVLYISFSEEVKIEDRPEDDKVMELLFNKVIGRK